MNSVKHFVIGRYLASSIRGVRVLLVNLINSLSNVSIYCRVIDSNSSGINYKKVRFLSEC